MFLPGTLRIKRTTCLDAIKKILYFGAIGSSYSMSLRPVEVIKAAILLNPYVVIILVHNHTTDDPTPIPEDEKFIARLFIATKALGIFLHDHIIIGLEVNILVLMNQDY